ncbi:MAG: NHLP leader peptide family RiPP precursor [Gammaproteobacteria bacterium]|nr:NHLP leader peptide family RiPP precursor [Gammaproteobacteria bacterium]
MKATEMLEHLLSRAGEDQDFRARLLSDPEATLKDEYGFKVPEGMVLKVVEDSRSTSHLVLPPDPQLSMEEMRVISGGIGNPDDANEGTGGGDTDYTQHPIFHDN